MIKLMVDDRCHDCEDFEPMTEKLNQYRTSRQDTSDTCVVCAKADRCQKLGEKIVTAPGWIYEDPFVSYGDDVRLLDDIHEAEKILGFKLFYWQKHFILHGIERCTGRTTAEQLRYLLRNKNEIIYVTSKGTYFSTKLYKQNLIRMQNELNAHGIRTAKIKM